MFVVQDFVNFNSRVRFRVHSLEKFMLRLIWRSCSGPLTQNTNADVSLTRIVGRNSFGTRTDLVLSEVHHSSHHEAADFYLRPVSMATAVSGNGLFDEMKMK